MASVLPPASVMAAWPAPNYKNPESLGTLLIAFEIPLIVLAVITVTSRMISRYFLSKVALDDWLILLASIAAIILMVENCVAIKYGWGLHLYDFKIVWLEPAQKIALATEELFVITTNVTKLSILCFYYRVFASFKTFKILIWAGLIYTTAFLIIEVIVVLNQCAPVRAFWDLSVKGKCINHYVAVWVTSLLNSASDFYVFALPIKYVWGLQLPQKQRIGLSVAFGLGGIVCIAGLIRLYYVKLAMHDSWDVTWYGAPLYITTAIECDIGLLCASIPALKPLLIKLFPNLSSTTRSRGDPASGQASHRMNRLDNSHQGSYVRSQVQRVRGEDESEDYILEDGLKPHVGPGIEKKVEIQVTSAYVE